MPGAMSRSTVTSRRRPVGRRRSNKGEPVVTTYAVVDPATGETIQTYPTISDEARKAAGKLLQAAS